MPSLRLKASSERRVGAQPRQSRRECIDVRGLDEQRIPIVGHVLRNPIDVRGEDCGAGLERLEQRYRPAALLERGQHEHVSVLEVGGRGVDVAGDRDAGGAGQSFSRTSVRCASRSGPGPTRHARKRVPALASLDKARRSTSMPLRGSCRARR